MSSSVSAENHFTLFAKEFLWNACNKKAYLFIVINKCDRIRTRINAVVLEQLKQLTYEDAEDLVHFVDSASALQPFTANPAFDLESSLRSFVRVKCSKCKLQFIPAYLSNNLLSNIGFLTGANAIVADVELQN